MRWSQSLLGLALAVALFGVGIWVRQAWQTVNAGPRPARWEAAEDEDDPESLPDRNQIKLHLIPRRQ